MCEPMNPAPPVTSTFIPLHSQGSARALPARRRRVRRHPHRGHPSYARGIHRHPQGRHQAESFYRGQKTPEEMTARELRQYLSIALLRRSPFPPSRPLDEARRIFRALQRDGAQSPADGANEFAAAHLRHEGRGRFPRARALEEPEEVPLARGGKPQGFYLDHLTQLDEPPDLTAAGPDHASLTSLCVLRQGGSVPRRRGTHCMTSAQDPSRMLDLIVGLPRMVAEAWAFPADPPGPSMHPTTVVALGLRGSAL